MLKRLKFITQSTGLCLALSMSKKLISEETDFDKYGGYKGLKFKATGFFRVAKKQDKWWFITPDGHSFLSFAMTHVNIRKLQQPHNKTYWENNFKVSEKSLNNFQEKFNEKLNFDLKNTGMNSIFDFKPKPNSDQFNYYASVRMTKVDYFLTPQKEAFKDVFSNDFVTHCDSIAKNQVSSRAKDPRLMGFFLGYVPVLVDQEAEAHGDMLHHKGHTQVGTTWPIVLRNLGKDSPGKHEYIKCMQSIYSDIKEFNDTYTSDFKDWNQLLKTKDWRTYCDFRTNTREVRDNLEFLYKILDRRYEVEVAAIRKYAPNHLIFGEKFHGNAPVPNKFLEIYNKHFDVIMLQHYATFYDINKKLDEMSKYINKPIIISDFSYTVPKHPEMPSPFGVKCSHQHVRADQAYKSFVGTFKRPEFIGWVWCGWMDNWESVEEGKQHSGFQDPFGNYDKEIVEIMKHFSGNMYKIHRGS